MSSEIPVPPPRSSAIDISQHAQWPVTIVSTAMVEITSHILEACDARVGIRLIVSQGDALELPELLQRIHHALKIEEPISVIYPESATIDVPDNHPIILRNADQFPIEQIKRHSAADGRPILVATMENVNGASTWPVTLRNRFPRVIHWPTLDKRSADLADIFDVCCDRIEEQVDVVISRDDAERRRVRQLPWPDVITMHVTLLRYATAEKRAKRRIVHLQRVRMPQAPTPSSPSLFQHDDNRVA